MGLLTVLEEKINQLIVLAVDLKKENNELRIFVERLRAENEELRSENSTIIEDNTQLAKQIRAIEMSMKEETEHISMLNEEKTLAKIVVDDLIKSIDALVERENQQ